MNIVYFHTHDTGRYLRHYGYYDSPSNEISDWAERESLTFRNAFCAGPTCSPSRAALLTGKYPHDNGMLGLANRGFAITDYEDHLVRILNRNGYRTALCGVQHEGAGCFDSEKGAQIIGYQDNLTSQFKGSADDGEATASWDRRNTEIACQWIDSRQEQPFFLSMGLFSTHRVYPDLKSVNPDFIKPPFYVPDTPESRIDHASFLESVKTADWSFGRILNCLLDSGQYSNTAIILTTDHGLALPFAKCNLTDTGIGVAMNIRFPGQNTAGCVSNALVSQVDVLPTICEKIGIDRPESVTGRSFLNLLDGAEDKHNQYIFAETNYHTSYEPMRCIRNDRFKLIRNYDSERPYCHLSNIDNSPSKELMMSNGLAETSKEGVVLYDLTLDPAEKDNVVGKPPYKEVLRELSLALTQWQYETNDPILNGELKPEEHQIINRPECIEPASSNPDDYI